MSEQAKYDPGDPVLVAGEYVRTLPDGAPAVRLHLDGQRIIYIVRAADVHPVPPTPDGDRVEVAAVALARHHSPGEPFPPVWASHRAAARAVVAALDAHPTPDPRDTALLLTDDSVKMVRETLCVAQTRIGRSLDDAARTMEHIERLGRLVAECDRHRPLGSDGKHGNLHTATCGCEDKT